MKGFPGGMQSFLKQANQLQNKMQKLQEELKLRNYSASSGGGVVQISVNGDHQLLHVDIKPEILQTNDKEMLQDLILAAANEALKMAKQTSEAEMNKLTGGINIPGVF